jgi:hypothetical protein
MSEVQKPDSTPNTRSDSNLDVGTGNQLDKETGEKDPETWYGLVWRIVRAALENDRNLIRVCALIFLVCVALWFIASVVKLRPRGLA